MSGFASAVLHRPASVAEAVALLAAGGPDAAPLAGGTWIMRAPIRHEEPKRAYVCLAGLPGLGDVTVTAAEARLGAGATHAAIAEGLAGCPDLRGLAEAAGQSANPAVRGAATLGGNLCTVGFPAADLLPALLSLEADVILAGPRGVERLGLAAFLARRAGGLQGVLLTEVVVRRSARRSAHARLPLRKAGDYPVAILSLAVEADAAGRIAASAVAIGAVETTARRWTALEDALRGAALDPDRAFEAAKRLRGGIAGRDGIEAPGWYRVEVLPSLVRRAMAAVAGQASSGEARPCRSC